MSEDAIFILFTCINTIGLFCHHTAQYNELCVPEAKAGQIIIHRELCFILTCTESNKKAKDFWRRVL